MTEHNHALHSKEEQVKGLLSQVSAYIEQYHAGFVEYIALDGDKLTVRVGGSCTECPMLPSTLQGWVAGTIRQFFPDIEVVAVD